IHDVAAAGFSAGTDAYDRGRPSYPQEAVDLIVDELGIDSDTTVVDLAAGTGKFTALIVPTGADVVAVEPVAEMRETLASTVPDVLLRPGARPRRPRQPCAVDQLRGRHGRVAARGARAAGAEAGRRPARALPASVHDARLLVQQALLSWSARTRRDLPWRHTRDPWAILVSEVMLQQTQVSRVVPKYHAFLERFPSAPVCAAAPVAEVVRAWAGLGYNRRA